MKLKIMRCKYCHCIFKTTKKHARVCFHCNQINILKARMVLMNKTVTKLNSFYHYKRHETLFKN